MQEKKDEDKSGAASEAVLSTDVSATVDEESAMPQTPTQQAETEQQRLYHGPKLWLLLAGLYLGIYLLALEMTMLSTVTPTLTDEFGTVADISWYESSYVIALCILTPLVGKLYKELRVKLVYLVFMVIFEAGLLICALAPSSRIFIVGRAINGLGSAGQFSGSMLIIGASCAPNIRPAVSAAAISMISVGSMTGPIIAGVLTARVGWRWCFWMLLPMGAAIMLILFLMDLPETSDKPPLLEALKRLPRALDPVGFVVFGAAITMLLLALTWGGGQLPWSSPVIIGLLVGGVALVAVFCVWAWFRGEDSLIPPSCLAQRSVYVGSFVIFLQGGASQAIPFFLPLWFQAVKGDGPSESAVHLMPSLVTNLLALMAFGIFVRKLGYIPPWSIVGSLISGIGSGLLGTLTPDASVGRWVGYQILTTFGRGIAFQSPISSVQEFVPMAQNPECLATLNLFLQLGLAVSVSACQTIFSNQLPALLARYAPDVNAAKVLEAGATRARDLIQPYQMEGFLKAYNQAVTEMFYFTAATSVLAGFISFGLEWKDLRASDEKKKEEEARTE